MVGCPPHIARQLLLQTQTDLTLSVADYVGATPTYVSAQMGFLEVTKILVEDASADANIVNKAGYSPLYAACLQGHFEIVRYLLSRTGAKINFCGNEQQCTPIYAAASKGWASIVQCLLAHGADPNLPTAEGLTPLHAAASCVAVAVTAPGSGNANIPCLQEQLLSFPGHLECIKLLLEAGADMAACDDGGRSVVFMAAEAGNLSVIEYLFSFLDAKTASVIISSARQDGSESAGCVNVHKTNCESCSPLFVAAKFGHADVVRYLLTKGAAVNGIANPRDANVCQEFDRICSHLTSMYGVSREQASAYLARAGADVDVSLCTHSGCTPVNIAAFGGHTAVVIALIGANADLSIANSDGYTPLFTAAAKGQTQTFVVILEYLKQQHQGSTLDFLNIRNSNGDSIILFVAKSGQDDIFSCLLQEGIDIDAQDLDKPFLVNSHERPVYGLIHSAVLEANQTMLRLLIRFKAKVDLIMLNSSEGISPLYLACLTGDADCVKILLEAGADVNLQASHGTTPIGVAAAKGFAHIIQLLLETKKVNLCLQCHRGDTPLINACLHGHIQAATLLLLYKPELIDMVNNPGHSPLYVAAQSGHHAIVQLLIDHKANLDIQATDETTPVYIAEVNQHTNIVKLLVMAGAEFPMKLNCGWVISKSSVVMGGCLVRLINSMESDDVEFVKKIAERYIGKEDKGLPLLYYLVELGFNLDGLIQSNTHEAVRRGIEEMKRRRAKYPVHSALRQFAYTNEKLVSLIRANAASVTDIDYFGNTALMVAINVDAPDCVLHEIMHQALNMKLTRRFNSLMKINPKLTAKHQFPSFRWNTPVTPGPGVKVYIEVRIVTDGLFQIGVASSDWDPQETGQTTYTANSNNPQTRTYGVGDCPYSIGLDLSRQCYFENAPLAKSLKNSPPKWTRNGVVGVCIDAEAMVVEFLLNGVKLIGDHPFSLDHYCQDAEDGIVFALTVSPGQKCEVNFGESTATPLMHKPAGYKSAAEYVGKGFVPMLQMRNSMTSVWEYAVPNEDCCVSKYYYDWFHVINNANERLLGVASTVIQKNAHFIREIANDVNETDHRAIDIAAKTCRRAIHSILYFAERYDLTSTTPDYESNMTVLMLATDSRTKAPVAIKLMKTKENFEQELRGRQGLDPAFVISILDSFDGDTNPKFKEELRRRGEPFQQFNYCVVMPAARRNLYQILGAENISGKDNLGKVRRLFEDIVLCVAHLHSKGVLHADIKPLNVMRNADDKLILIDLDASCSIGSVAGLKCSSAYVPPEMLYYDTRIKKYRLKKHSNIVPSASSAANTDQRAGDDGPVTQEEQKKKPSSLALGDSFQGEGESSRAFEPLEAHPSFDVWSLGVVLYHICTGEPMFLCSNDNIEQFDRRILFDWKDQFKQAKLNKIADLQARNLVSRMLTKDPAKRPLLSAILQHPFVSGSKGARMVGDEAKFDVFLSYRVLSDSVHCEMLYNLLVNRELKVWWDKRCLEGGKKWEEGFCDGLVQSKVFVCLISEQVVNGTSGIVVKGAPEKVDEDTSEMVVNGVPQKVGDGDSGRVPSMPFPPRCFASLAEDSLCDNVLLEHQIALELEAMTMLSSVYPVFIGSPTARGTAEYSNFNFNCMKSLPKVVVRSVAEKVAEHLDRQRLGTPLFPYRTVQQTADSLNTFQGGFIVGNVDAAFECVADAILKVCRPERKTAPLQSLRSVSTMGFETSNGCDTASDLVSEHIAEIAELQKRIQVLERQLKGQRE
jgi:ankyrin repeat protein/serine/threonine protein kinase